MIPATIAPETFAQSVNAATCGTIVKNIGGDDG